MVFLWACFSAPALFAESKVVHLAAPAYWCPYACDSKSGEIGYAVEIAIEALKSQNIEAQYSNVPYQRIQRHLISGRIDGIVGSYKDEVENAIYPKNALFSSHFCFYSVHQNTFTWRGEAKDLNNYKLIVTGGYKYAPEIDNVIAAKGPNLQILNGNNITARAFKMLESNRAQLFFEDLRVYEYQRIKGTINKAKNKGCLSQKEEGFLALTPARKERSKQIAESFDKGLTHLKQTQALQSILKKYGITGNTTPSIEN